MQLILVPQNRILSNFIVCSNKDFNTALEMIKILVQHAARVFDALPADPAPSLTDNPKLALLQTLPQQFDRT